MVARGAGIRQATYFNWKKKYDGLSPTEGAPWQESGRYRRLSSLAQCGHDPVKHFRKNRKGRIADALRCGVSAPTANASTDSILAVQQSGRRVAR